MFDSAKVFDGFAVDDLKKAREFYAEVLGVEAEVIDEGMGLMSVRFGGGLESFVYVKPDFEPATYTILNFEVEDIDLAVDALTERGVELERYEGFDQDEKGIARGGDGRGPSIAWFKDPAGNVLSVLQQQP